MKIKNTQLENSLNNKESDQDSFWLVIKLDIEPLESYNIAIKIERTWKYG